MYQNILIKSYKEAPEGTYLMILVPHVSLTNELKICKTDGRVKGELKLDDPRLISAEQRKKAYATIADIAFYLGYASEEVKEILKVYYCISSGEKMFSLSNCSRTTARKFISYILDFALEWGIPLADLGINRTDDISAYLYSCLKHKRCCRCGRDGEIHHIDTIGMGNNRKTLDDSKHKKMCLCRECHTEIHRIGVKSFCDKYKVYGIVFEGEVVCRDT